MNCILLTAAVSLLYYVIAELLCSSARMLLDAHYYTLPH